MIKLFNYNYRANDMSLRPIDIHLGHYRGAVKLQYVITEEQIVDVLTKPLARMKFEYFRKILVVI